MIVEQFEQIAHTAKILVVGITREANNVDEALRKPGRFDREIEVPVPGQRERYLILTHLLKQLPSALSDDEARELGTDATRGFVGGDLVALCKEAVSACLRRSWRRSASNDFTALLDSSCRPTLADVTVTRADFREALVGVVPSALAAVTLDVPHVKWSDIGGQSAAKAALREMVEWPLRHADSFRRLGVEPPRGVLLYGPPGCSKTLLAKALATESHVNFLAIKGPEVFNKWVGESEKAVRGVFDRARAAAPSVVFIDEIDSIGGSRGSVGSDVHSRVLTQLLQEMDGLQSSKEVCVVAATNRPDRLDEALLRPGRFDRCVHVSLPDEKDRVEVWRVVLKSTPISLTRTGFANLDELIVELVGLSDGLTGAEIANVMREASMSAISEDPACVTVPAEFILRVARDTTPTVSKTMLRYFEKFERDHGAGVS